MAKLDLKQRQNEELMRSLKRWDLENQLLFWHGRLRSSEKALRHESNLKLRKLYLQAEAEATGRIKALKAQIAFVDSRKTEPLERWAGVGAIRIEFVDGKLASFHNQLRFPRDA